MDISTVINNCFEVVVKLLLTYLIGNDWSIEYWAFNISKSFYKVKRTRL
jgi:hypothetical protein